MFKQLDGAELNHIGYKDKILMFPEVDAVCSNGCDERTGEVFKQQNGAELITVGYNAKMLMLLEVLNKAELGAINYKPLMFVETKLEGESS